MVRRWELGKIRQRSLHGTSQCWGLDTKDWGGQDKPNLGCLSDAPTLRVGVICSYVGG